MEINFNEGHLTLHNISVGCKAKYTCDLNDNLIKVTDPLGRQTQYEYDVMDNLTKITDAVGKESSFTYGFGGVGFIAIGGLGASGASHALGAT